MASPRIYTAQDLEEGQLAELEETASRHVAGALRLRTGNTLILFNGTGGEYLATVSGIERKQVTVMVGAFREHSVESPLHIHLGIVISRGERMDWVIQKSTELGVSCISPLFSERCEVKLNLERSDKKLRHWQQIAISACEQSGRNRVPTLAPASQLLDWCSTVQVERKLLLHPEAPPPRLDAQAPVSVALLTGPEGGMTDAEMYAAQAQGFELMALGPRVLRTETAPLSAIAILQSHWGDMR